MRDISSKELTIFNVVKEEKSFTKSGEKLFIAQPSISKTIQKLENELNVTLFDRSKRTLTLTDAGEVVYKHSKNLLGLLEQMQIELNELSDLMVGKLSIGLPQIIGAFIFPPIVQEFSQRYPGVTLSIEENGGLVTERHVEMGSLDIGFVVLPVDNPNLLVEQIYEDSFVLCVSSHHPLARRDTISLEEAKHEKFILFDRSFALHGVVIDACKKSGFAPTMLLESTQWDLILELVSAQMGVSIVPRVLADKLNNINIVSIPITSPELKWQIGMISNSKSYQSFALKGFVEVVQEIYSGNRCFYEKECIEL